MKRINDDQVIVDGMIYEFKEPLTILEDRESPKYRELVCIICAFSKNIKACKIAKCSEEERPDKKTGYYSPKAIIIKTYESLK